MGFNVDIDAGASVGQTLFRVYVHLIPRGDGNVANPNGDICDTSFYASRGTLYLKSLYKNIRYGGDEGIRTLETLSFK